MRVIDVSRGWLGCALATLLALCLPAQELRAEDLARLAGTVTRVIDGDTIDVQLATGPIRVRLYAVDTPERDQPWWREAEDALSDLVLGRQVELEPFEQDRYDRLVARVFLADRDINGELIREGHAWAFRKYMTKDDVRYCAYEMSAREARRGLWRLQRDDRVPPWRWRRVAAMTSSTYWEPEEPTEQECVFAIGRN